MKNLYIKSYGCQMNVYDNDFMKSIIAKLGYKEVKDAETADLIILNTCHIRHKAVEKVYSELGVLNHMAKKQQRKIMTVVAGCLAQAEGGEIAKRAPNVDIIVGTQALHNLPELIMKANKKNGIAINLDFSPMEKFDYLNEEIKNKEKQYLNNISAFLSIQEGCDKFCTYCVVPYTRGMEYSRPVEDIYNEALLMADNGVKEIVLLGQNVNGYHGKNSDNKVFDLSMLIEKLALIPKIERIRYTTSHPNDMHDGLYYMHSIEKKLMPFLHLPVQSGSNKILKKMNRKYTVDDYLKSIEKLRYVRKDIAFSSDFIVGFAGETEEDFEQTMNLVKTVNFAQAYSFKYSARPGTPGAEFKDQIDENIKSDRLYRLQDLLKEQQLSFNQSKVGKILEVLFDRKNDMQVIGKTHYGQVVYDNNLDLYGKTVNMLIDHASQNTLKGTVVDLHLA